MTQLKRCKDTCESRKEEVMRKEAGQVSKRQGKEVKGKEIKEKERTGQGEGEGEEGEKRRRRRRR